MWNASTDLAAPSRPRALWRLLEDIAGWTGWSQHGAPDGPRGASRLGVANPGDLAAGAGNAMSPGGRVNERTDAAPFAVSHELRPLVSGGTRVVYAIRVDGPEAATLGPLVSVDLPEVLAALRALAERPPGADR